MSNLKIWVILKMLRRGVQPDKELLDRMILYIEPHTITYTLCIHLYTQYIHIHSSIYHYIHTTTTTSNHID